METLKTMLIDPFIAMLGYVTGFIPTLVSALIVLVAGVFVAKILGDVIHRIFKEIKTDKLADKIGLSDALRKGGVKYGVSELLGSLVYIVVMFIFFIMTLKAVGITVMTGLIDYLVSYIPQVLSAVLILVLGLVVAKVVASIVHTVAHLTHMPNPKFLERLTRWAVIIHAATISLRELGYGAILEGTTFHILFGGFVFAYALAFGLGGKDRASKYMDRRAKK